jgi:hypothetical protein
MDKYKSKYEITIHNHWTVTTLRTYDIRVAANHMIYKSRQPPSSSPESIDLTIDGVKYDVKPQPFQDPLSRGSNFDAVHQKIIEDIQYCVDLHEALYKE